MAKDPTDLLQRMFAQQESAANRGYADLLNEVIDTLRTLTVWTSGYTTAEQTQVPKGYIAAAKREVEIMLQYAQEGQADYYETGVMGVAQGILNLTDAFKDDPIVSMMYSPKLKNTGMAMLGATKHTVVESIDAQKDQVDTSPLELVSAGLKAMDAGEPQRKAFYQTNKQYGPQ